MHLPIFLLFPESQKRIHNFSVVKNFSWIFNIISVNKIVGLNYKLTYHWVTAAPTVYGWMDELGFYIPFNSSSVISRQWKGEHERLCAMKCRLGSGRIPPPAGFKPATPWSEVGSANLSGTWLLHCLLSWSMPKLIKWFELQHDKTNKMTCVPSEDSDQPGHPPSLNCLRCALNG